MFNELELINRRPGPYEFYTARLLWTDEHVSKKMLELHLNRTVDLASRNEAFIGRSVQWIAEHFGVGGGTKVCDFGCGPGLYATQFAGLGAEVTGIDFSERSVRYARQTAQRLELDVEYVLQDYLQFSTDRRFDLITMIYLDFCPLSPQQRAILLQKFRDYLAPGGAVLLDVLSLSHFESVEEKAGYEYCGGDGFWSAAPYYVFTNTFKYDDEKVVLDKYAIFEKGRSREIYNWLQCYSLDSLEKELAENGFAMTEYYADVAGADYSGDSAQMAVVARRAS